MSGDPSSSMMPGFCGYEHYGSRGISRAIGGTQSPATRPEDLGVTPWYLENSLAAEHGAMMGEKSSYLSFSCADGREANGRPELVSTRNSSVESDLSRHPPHGVAHRKAYMDLRDAIAMLDETCPNPEPSPSLTPRTPRTPLTPYPRNKRARSKSSDNSSNYSNDRLSDRSFENAQPHDKEKKRPFLRKIGISKTEDRPFLAKFTPRIIGKPYLEKIGPSRAVERPFLEKIGSSKTVDKFTFEASRVDRIDEGRSKCKEESIERTATIQETGKKSEKDQRKEPKPEQQLASTGKRRSGKGFLLKMYSFETEDLDEATNASKDPRDPLRGASLDDVLDSGPSSLPPIDSAEESPPKPELECRPTSIAELLKCRVTTSEEIISSSPCVGSPREANSWGNSPRRRSKTGTTPRTPTRRKVPLDSREGTRSDESTPNSPTKRPISADTLEKDFPYSPTKSRRQTLEDTLERSGRETEMSKIAKQNQFERRGISSDNLLSRDITFSIAGGDIYMYNEKKREAASEDSLAICRDSAQEYTKETFKQLQDKFEMRDLSTETYAAFKRRTKHGALHISTIHRLKVNSGGTDNREEVKVSTSKVEDTLITIRPPETDREEDELTDPEEFLGETSIGRSVLKKQEGIDHLSDQESDTNASLIRPKRRIFHEPSQETMDLLTELRKVKSLLKTPSWEKDYDLEKKPTRLPKRILLTDKEFCLSVERENSVRRPSRAINVLERSDEQESITQEPKIIAKGEKDGKHPNGTTPTPGPALFEKRCLSLDYADEEKPQKPELRAISLASAREIPSVGDEAVDYSDLGLMCDSKSFSSDVFNTPSEETVEKQPSSETESKLPPKTSANNHCAEVDIAIPIDQKVSSPKGRTQIQGRTSDLYEIISPRSTPFRVKKRLGKISVEETVKPESFTLGSKVDCRSVVAQKRTKCFPL